MATPGHTANHMAYALKEKNLLFAGDHVMAWATSIVAPPDGAMSDYMASLRNSRSAARRSICPATGRRSQTRRASSTTTSCTARRAKPRSCTGWRKGETDIPTIVRAIYIGIDPRLTGAAGLSVLAHLEDLVARGLVETDGMPAIDGVYRSARVA